MAYTYTNVTVDDGQKNRSKKPVDMPAQNNKLNTVLNWDSISGAVLLSLETFKKETVSLLKRQ